MVKKTPVGAHYGLRDWVAQRATAAVMLAAFGVIFAMLVVCRPDSYEEWRAFVLHGAVRVLLFCTVLSLAWHAFIGARDIYMDYLKNDVLRLFKTLGVIVYLIACVVWAAKILL
ncbi:MAG: succinate dehydrogenase, hydrophobic membrane anchor protein [Gammaproteobacteria bacterium]